MFIKNWKKEIRSIPNLLSLFRLMIIPVYVLIYLTADNPMQYTTAGFIIILSCLTDFFDGIIARRFNMITTLGKILDPLADKITQFTLALCRTARFHQLGPVVILILLKESLQAIIAYIHFKNGHILSNALYAGKICTAVLFCSLITLVLFPNLKSRIVDFIVYTDIFFLLISFSCYLLAYLGKNGNFEDVDLY